MSSLADQYTYSQNATLQNQARVAMVSAAIAIAGEAAAFDRDKRRLAFQILSPNGIANYLPTFALAICNDATVSTTIASGGASSTATDTQIQNAVNAAWAAIATQN